MNSGPKRVIVIGCGNRFASDEAAGLEVGAQLRRRPGHICEVREIESCSPGFLSELPPDTTLIFVDSIQTGARPGTIHALRFPLSHAVRIRNEIRMLLPLAEKVSQMYLVGIEIEKSDPGIGVTSSVHAAVLEVVKQLSKLVKQGRPPGSAGEAVKV
jgi:hydrogenase maturation protease